MYLPRRSAPSPLAILAISRCWSIRLDDFAFATCLIDVDRCRTSVNHHGPGCGLGVATRPAQASAPGRPMRRPVTEKQSTAEIARAPENQGPIDRDGEVKAKVALEPTARSPPTGDHRHLRTR
jgi:hypothetical protein